MPSLSNKWVAHYGSILLSAWVLCGVAFYNGYPLFYSDTQSYLSSGFDLIEPESRPIIYGLFIRLSSLNGLSLWTVVFCQNLILTLLIRWTLIHILETEQPNLSLVLITTLLSLTTPVGWVSGELIADIFTPIGIISSALFLFSGDLSKGKKITLILIFILSTASHNSNIFIFNTVLLFILILGPMLSRIHGKRVLFVKKGALLMLCSLFAIPFLMGPSQRSSHVFLMGKMLEAGIAQPFLEEHCPEKSYKLCPYLDELPAKSTQFIWNPKSPLYKTGGWKSNRDEFREIIYKSLITPKYFLLHLRESLKSTLKQLITISPGDGVGPFLESSLPYQRVRSFFPHELNRYLSSRQNQKTLTPSNQLLYFYAFTSLISFVFLVIFLSQVVSIRTQLTAFILMLLFSVLVNAWLMGTLGNVIPRFGTRMVWLIPLSFYLVSVDKILRFRNF